MRRLIGAVQLALGAAIVIPALTLARDHEEPLFPLVLALAGALLALAGLLELVTGESARDLAQRFREQPIWLRKLIAALVLLVVAGGGLVAFLLYARSTNG
jgi:hypothetical protein